jgi:phage virion morphogenesis protein
MITVSMDSRSVVEALADLRGKVSDLAPALQDIGEHLTETTKRRFDTSTAPDGSKWADNSDVTILQYLGSMKGVFGKRGGMTKKGMTALLSKKPLVGHGDLGKTIFPVYDDSSVSIGSRLPYSAMQQFGGTRAEFPNLWGDIPARPFLGLSGEDERSILDIVAGYMGF